MILSGRRESNGDLPLQTFRPNVPVIEVKKVPHTLVRAQCHKTTSSLGRNFYNAEDNLRLHISQHHFFELGLNFYNFFHDVR